MQSNYSIKMEANKLICGPTILIFGFLFSVFLHKQLGMDGSWDTANYHLYLGWATSKFIFYEFGALAQYHTYLNPIIDVLNYTSFSIHPFIGATLHSIFFSVVSYITYKIAQCFLSDDWSDSLLLLTGLIICMTGAMTISLFGSWTNENINAVFVLAGLYFLLRGIESGILLLIFSSGLAFGIALGLKLTAAHYLVGALFATLVSTKFNVKIISLLCVGILIGFLATDGWFMYLRWKTVDSPIFPFANNIFKSPFYPVHWKSFSHFDPAKTLYYLSLPIIWLNSGDFSEANTVRDGRFLLAYIGIGLIVLDLAVGRKIDKMEYALITFFVISFIAWLLAFRIYRYLVALEMISGILFIIGLRRLRSSRIGLANIYTASGALFFLWIITVYPNWGRREWSENFSKNDIRELIKEKAGSVVFFADQRLSYLAPGLYEEQIQFANLYSQKWWDGKRESSVEDPDYSSDPSSIDLSKFNKIYFLQNSKSDPRSRSTYLRKLFPYKYYVCQNVSTNMPGSPVLCLFSDASDQP